MVIVGAMLVIIPLAFVASQAVLPKSLFEERIGEMDNVLGRLETWKIALRQGLEQPITGIGLNNTRDLLAQSRTSIQEASGTGFTYTTVHNSFLTFFAELGIIGLVLYLSIVAAILRVGWQLYRRGQTRALQWRGVAIIAILIGYLAPGFFANTLQMFGFGHFLVFGLLGGLIGVSYKAENLAAAEDLVPISDQGRIEVEPAMARVAQLQRDKYRTVKW
jgi:O-antigen ligase